MDTQNCINKQDAIDALEEGFKDVTVGINKFGPTYGLIEAVTGIYKCLIGKLPPAQSDLSEYSDKLWQKAYERGKAEAQAEIVRCKDCRFNTYSKKCLNPDSFFLVPADDFYCGYAERKTDE